MPNLQLQYTDIQLEVGLYLGYGSDPSQWQPEQTAQVDRIIQDGYRQFLWPPPMQDISSGNPFGPINWTFLKPLGQLQTLAPINGTQTSSTTLSLTDSAATFTASGLISAVIKIVCPSGAVYSRQITANTGTQATWPATGYNGGAITESMAGAKYTVYQEDYDLPADFERLDGRLMFSPDDSRPWPIEIIDEQAIRRRREFPMVVSCAVWACAISRHQQVGNAQQRYQLMFWPRPDKVYHLNFRYEAVPPPLSLAYPYPAGTASLSDVLLTSCLSVAEKRIGDEAGVYSQEFVAKIQAAALKDRQAGPEHIGYNGNHSGQDGFQYGVWNRTLLNGVVPA